MKPGKVGETFDIFTTPSPGWWNWATRKGKDVEVIAASPPRVHIVDSHIWSFAKIWERRLMDGDAKIEERVDQSLRCVFSRTKNLIDRILTRIFGV